MKISINFSPDPLFPPKYKEQIKSKIPPFLFTKICGIPLWSELSLLLLAFILQLVGYGNPAIQSDQQYYMYGGGQILQGKIPYVDFWDRKPVGLFLLYAVFHTFGPLRWWALPIGTAISCWVGALGIIKICQSLKLSILPTYLASILYLLGQTADLDIIGGQAENFYLSLFIWATVPIFHNWNSLTKNPRQLFVVGCWAMLLCGLAIQIKTSCALEGTLLGNLLLWMSLFHAGKWPIRLLRTLSFGMFWILLALLPTTLVILWYETHHFFSEWLWANVQNLVYWHRNAEYHFYRKILLNVTVDLTLALPVIFSVWKFSLPVSREKNQIVFLLLWAFLTLFGGLLLRQGAQDGIHYLAPCFIPMILLLALLWDNVRGGKIFLLFFLCLGIPSTLHGMNREGKRFKTYKKMSYILAQQPGCLFEIGGHLIFFDAHPDISSCGLTKFQFPDTLIMGSENETLAINRREEIRQALKKRPLYLIVQKPFTLSLCEAILNCPFKVKQAVFELRHNYYPGYDLLTTTIKNFYTPVAGMRNKEDESIYYGLYKLKSGLTPGIMPEGIPAEPSRPINSWIYKK